MGLRLFFLPNFLGAMFIQRATFIPDSRVFIHLSFNLIVPLQEVVNNHEGLAKRFSMNYMDTVGNGKDKRFYRFLPRNFFNPSDFKRSGKYYLEESNFLKTKLPTPIKRFSMNFLDTLDNPQQKRFSMNYLDSLNNPQQKRFSMNYMDTLKNSKQKKFSMNFLDSLDQQPRRKRFTMNFMDTLGQKGLLSKHRSSLSGHHRREENGKISTTLQVIDISLIHPVD